LQAADCLEETVEIRKLKNNGKAVSKKPDVGEVAKTEFRGIG
jgi:hypothetical protein